MKNLKKFNDLLEKHDTFFMKVEAAYNTLNVFHLLMDEGYFDAEGNPVQSLEDCNTFIKDQTELIAYDYFKNENEMKQFKKNIKIILEKLISNL